MIENNFILSINHSKCIDGKIERSDCSAYKIDDENGLATSLGFPNSMLPKVDYFSKTEDEVQLIELSDLENDIKNCNISIDEEIKKVESVQGKRLTAKEKRPIRKKAWSPITSEFTRKWCGSIAVIERLYRKNNILENDPKYQLLIVCKNKTDIILLDSLKIKLKGMMNTVVICNTKNISNYLLSDEN